MEVAKDILNNPKTGTVLGIALYGAFVFYMYRRVQWDMFGRGTTSRKILGGKSVTLTKQEDTLAHAVTNPADIEEDFDCVGGLSDAKQLLQDHVVFPFRFPELEDDRSIRGILLYGPPGTGKTMLARALAKEMSGTFIQISIEDLFTKYIGDSEKLGAAVFSLAEKLAPCVVFIDEIDSLLSSRTGGESAQVYTNLKTIFMAKWDGIKQLKGQIVIVGATNRRESLDAAIHRRMPIQIYVPLPDCDARKKILMFHLRADLRKQPDLPVAELAVLMHGYSGSDISNVCTTARRIRNRVLHEQVSRNAVVDVPLLTMLHFKEAMATINPYGSAADVANRQRK